MLAKITVYFGLPPEETSTNYNQHESSLVQFLYEKHQEFELEKTSTETYLVPQDELTLANLLMRDCSSKDELEQNANMLDLWIKINNYRFHQYAPILTESELQFANKVDEYLESNSIVDRTLIAKRLLEECRDNMDLKSKLIDCCYVVNSSELDWFELMILKVMTSYGMPQLTFSFTDDTKNQFFNFNLCRLNRYVCYKQYPALEMFLSYLGLSVNIKDSLRLLRIFNQPYRGLDNTTFSVIRRLSKEENLSAAQVLISFVGRLKLGPSSYAPAPNHPLRQWSTSLTHLVDFLTVCQDALSGADDDSRLATESSGSMTVDGALQAVKQCLITCYRSYRKPCPATMGLDQTKSGAVNLKMDELKSVLDDLKERSRLLCKSMKAQKLCSDTPGRALIEGGSLCGRAARKLVRLLLVVESERLRIYPTNSSTHLSKHPTDVRTPLRHLNSPRTPTTMGRSLKLLDMFNSPDTPVIIHPLNSADCLRTADQVTEDDHSDARFRLAFGKDQQSPPRSIFSRYQSGLDWADKNKSPLISKRMHLQTRYEPDLDTYNSMPAWSSNELDGVPKRLSDGTGLSEQSPKSECNTPTKLTSIPLKKSKLLFNDEISQSSHHSSVESLTANSNSKPDRLIPSKFLKKSSSSSKFVASRKTQKKQTVPTNQRSIRDFFC